MAHQAGVAGQQAALGLQRVHLLELVHVDFAAGLDVADHDGDAGLGAAGVADLVDQLVILRRQLGDPARGGADVALHARPDPAAFLVQPAVHLAALVGDRLRHRVVVAVTLPQLGGAGGEHGRLLLQVGHGAAVQHLRRHVRRARAGARQRLGIAGVGRGKLLAQRGQALGCDGRLLATHDAVLVAVGFHRQLGLAKLLAGGGDLGTQPVDGVVVRVHLARHVVAQVRVHQRVHQHDGGLRHGGNERDLDDAGPPGRADGEAGLQPRHFRSVVANQAIAVNRLRRLRQQRRRPGVAARRVAVGDQRGLHLGVLQDEAPQAGRAEDQHLAFDVGRVAQALRFRRGGPAAQHRLVAGNQQGGGSAVGARHRRKGDRHNRRGQAEAQQAPRLAPPEPGEQARALPGWEFFVVQGQLHEVSLDGVGVGWSKRVRPRAGGVGARAISSRTSSSSTR